MDSGITANNQCLDVYQSLYAQREAEYIIYRINEDKTSIVVDSIGEKEANYEEFLDRLPLQQGRYIVYDVKYRMENAQRSKVCFITWCPDDAPSFEKMLYTSSKQSFRKLLDGIACDIQANDLSDLESDVIMSKVLR